MTGTGTVTLTDSGNAITTIAANAGETISYRDSDGLTVGAVTVLAATTTGITTTADDVQLQSSTLSIDDNISLGAADLGINNSGAVTQVAGDTISATGLALTGTSTVTLTDTGNAITTIAANAGDTISYADSNNLVVGSVTVLAATTTGITTSDDNVTLSTASGTGLITVTNAITTVGVGTTGVVSLSGAVTVNNTLTAAGGNITLNGSLTTNPDITIAANVDSAGTINWSAIRDILIGARVRTTQAGSDITLTGDSDTDGAGGVQILAGGQVDAGNEVTIQGSDVNATGGGVVDSVNIVSDGTNNQVLAGGNICIGMQGIVANDAAQLLINGRVSTTGATADVNIISRGDVLFGADGDVLKAGGSTGVITVTADAVSTENDGFITMTDGAVLNAGSGTFNIDAAGNITIANITTTNATATAVAIDSTFGGIIDAGDTDVDIVADAV